MKQLFRFFLLCLMLPGLHHVDAQVISCPDNIDFERGDLTNWTCQVGYNFGSVFTNIWYPPVPPVPYRHKIVTGAGTDPYGGFPIVSPDGGLFTLKLGNDSPYRQMERVKYTFTIPATLNNYNLIYRYAIVFEDPQHPVSDQPFFKVVAYDDATNQAIACDSSLYVSSSNLPGFIETFPGSAIYYKDWTTTSLKLTGMAGRTVRVEFTTADCAQGQHFGYGYVDLSCGLFKVKAANCNSSPTTPLTAPPGFRQYTWYDNNYSTVIGNGQSIIIPTPSASTSFHVVLIPYPGYGCADTLTTQIVFSTLTANASPDSADLCQVPSAQLNTTQTGNAPPFTYSWLPALGLSCAYCPNPIAAPAVHTNYVVSVTDTNGCTVTDSVYVKAGVTVTETHSNVSCNGRNDGSIVVTATGGTPPYSFSWNTTPAQSGPQLINLIAGTYTVTIRDARNCVGMRTIVIEQPPALTTTGGATTVRCLGVGVGKVWVKANGGSPPYTYEWNSNPPQYTDTAFGLQAGVYTCTIRDAGGCPTTIAQEIVQTNPLLVNASVMRRSCPNEQNSEVIALTAGGTGPQSYSWNTTPVRTTPSINNIGRGTYIVTVKDSVGCIGKDTVEVTDYGLPPVSAGNDIEICAGETTQLNAAGAASYLWQTASTLSCNACASPVANPMTTTTYIVTGTDANNCKATDTITVHVIERVTVTVDSARQICLGDVIMLRATGGIYYEWTPSETLDAPFLATPLATPKVTTTYRVVITESRCFKDTLYQTITVKPLPSIDIMNGFNGIPGATLPITTTTVNARTITWSPPQGLSCTDCFQPVVTLDKTIIYVAEVTDSAGCKAKDTIKIVVGCDPDAFFMANTFTPNNDGRNDFFYPQGLGVNTVHRFMVYNRWGEVMFAATDVPVNVAERGWNGTFKGQELAPDVFMYAIEAVCPDGTPIVVRGDITLVR